MKTSGSCAASGLLARWQAALLPLLVIAPAATGLEELWHCDTWAASRSLPAVADHNGDGQPEAVFTTRYDGMVWVVGADGAIAQRYSHGHWLEGGIAAAVPPGKRGVSHVSAVFAFQESAGQLNLCNYDRKSAFEIELTGSPCIGTAPCFADLDGDGTCEVVVTRRNGVVTALDKTLTPLWQFDAGAPFDSSPAVAAAAVYVVAADGTLHCLSGTGEPLWRFRMAHEAPRFPAVAEPLVVQLAGEHGSVLVSDAMGWLYAVDAVTGHEQWRRKIGPSALGSPAIADVHANPGNEIVAVGQAGHIAVLSAAGMALEEARLPDAHYVPRPLVADVNGDGQAEILVATTDWTVLAAGLDGAVREVIELRGNALEGIVLADVNGDGLLELLAATECARLHCFATQAKTGWTHPRANFALDGCVPPIAPVAPAAPKRPKRRAPRPRSITVTEHQFSRAVLAYKKRPKASYVSAVIRHDGAVVGSAAKALRSPSFTVPFIQSAKGNLSVDLAFYDAEGKPVSASKGIPIRPASGKLVALAPPDAFLDALNERAAAYDAPAAWRLPQVLGRDSWHVARYMPEQWETFGLADEAFIAEAVPRLWAPANRPESIFGPEHEAWPFFEANTKPFFIMNDYFRPKVKYPGEDYAAIRAMAGERFLGFPVHEWAYHVWKRDLEPADPAPATRAEATALLEADFKELLDMCHGQIYQGQGYCLFHHQAFEWGAPMGYAEVGENIPCAPLQFAFLRGASRQYGGRPWGAYLSNWFRGVVADTRFREEPGLKWGPENYTDGLNCGHSPYLEFRLEVAAHLAGATFVHHESDGHHGSIFVRERRPDQYRLSRFGMAMHTWHRFARKYPDRGIPYTPIAFMLDFHHGWRPREDIYGLWPQQRPDRSIESMFRHVYAWDGLLDFERGYLTNGPYGDIFDAITNNAPLDVLNTYAAVWPLGDVSLEKPQRQALAEYVRQGGILVLDSASAPTFPDDLLGVRFGKRDAFATGIQTALGAVPPPNAPYRYRPMKPKQVDRVLAWTDTGAPLLAWRRHGHGLIIVSATHHWLDEREQLLPLAEVVLQTIAEAVLPVQWSSDIEVLINRTSDGWVIGLINNNGILKVPTRRAVLEPEGVRDCVLQFKGRVPLRFIPRLGTFRWSVQANGLHTHLNPGTLAVVEVRFSEKTPEI